MLQVLEPVLTESEVLFVSRYVGNGHCDGKHGAFVGDLVPRSRGKVVMMIVSVNYLLGRRWMVQTRDV